MTADDTFDDDWDVFIKDIPLPEESPFQKDLAAAAEVTKEKVAEFVTNMDQRPLDGNTFGSIVSRAVHIYLETLQERLKGKDLIGLLGFVLEGQGLSPQELKGFVRALPDKMLERMVNSVLSSANGTQALVAIEWHFRKGNLVSDYSLGITSQGRMYAKVPQSNDEEIVLFLEDHFDGIPSKTEIPDEHDSSLEVRHPTDSSTTTDDVEST